MNARGGAVGGLRAGAGVASGLRAGAGGGPRAGAGVASNHSARARPGARRGRGASRVNNVDADATVQIAELRTALAAGASATTALLGVGIGPLETLSRQLRLGRGLAELAMQPPREVAADPAALLLLRGLAVAERTGGSALAAVDQALEATAENARLRRFVRVRSTQARGTAVVLTLLPVAGTVLLGALSPGVWGFYREPLGIVASLVAMTLMAAGWRWSNRMIARSHDAPRRADPLVPEARWRAGRAAAAGVAVLVVGVAGAGPVLGTVLAALAAAVAGRPSGAGRPVLGDAGGTAETVELVAYALRAGLAPPAALGAVEPFVPLAARPLLQAATRRLGAGWPLNRVLADTPLASLGVVLAASERWGAPGSDALRALARGLRADRQATAEAEAERLELKLVFPTTLLTLPAFVLAVVPPLLWSAVRG